MFIKTIRYNKSFIPINLDLNRIKEYLEYEGEYELLLERFYINDPTLTDEDIATIYFASLFKKNNETITLNECEIQHYIDELEFLNAYYKVKKYLSYNLTSLIAISFMINICEGLNLTDKVVENYVAMYWRLLDVISKTGDGLSEKTAFKVINIDDEYQMVTNYFNIQNIKKQSYSISNNCDIIEFSQSNNYPRTQMYFKLLKINDNL